MSCNTAPRHLDSGFIGLRFTAISYTLIQIQLVEHDKFWKMAIDNHTHPEAIPPRRGAIFDADGYGSILAQTQRVYDIHLDGLALKSEHPETNLPLIESNLGLPKGSLVYNTRVRYQLIAHEVEESVVAKLKALDLDCIITESHDRRVYPNNELAAHALGFVDENGRGHVGHGKADGQGAGRHARRAAGDARRQKA